MTELKAQLSKQFATVSMILGVVSLIFCWLIYISLICGGLAIVFALISKGKELKLKPAAKVGCALGLLGIIAGVILTVISFIIIIHQFGSIDAFMESYRQLFDTYLAQLQQQ